MILNNKAAPSGPMNGSYRLLARTCTAWQRILPLGKQPRHCALQVCKLPPLSLPEDRANDADMFQGMDEADEDLRRSLSHLYRC